MRHQILITAGATRTHLDDLRFLTNPATGSLGSALAEYAAKNGAKVTFIHGPGSALPQGKHIQLVPVVSGRDAWQAIRRATRRTRFDAIFHTMGVEDFEFSKAHRGKLSSRIRALKPTLVPTPKIIDRMRLWAPGAFLVGCKLESRVSRRQLLASATALLTRTRADLVLANEWSAVQRGHLGYLVSANGSVRPVSGKTALARALWTAYLKRDRMES